MNKWDALSRIGATMRDTSHALRGEKSSYLSDYMKEIKAQEEKRVKSKLYEAAGQAWLTGTEEDFISKNVNNPDAIGALADFFKLGKAMKEPPLTYDKATSLAAMGELPYKELMRMFPQHMDSIAQQEDYFGRRLQPGAMDLMERADSFQEGRGLKAFFNRNVANLTPEIRAITNKIKTRADYEEYVEYITAPENAAKLEKAGINVDNVLKTLNEYYGIK